MSPRSPPRTRRQTKRSSKRQRRSRSFGSVPQAQEHAGSVNSGTSITDAMRRPSGPAASFGIIPSMYGKAFYDDVADALQSFLPPSLRDFAWSRTSHNLKLWFGSNDREHYEVQVFKKGKD